MKTENLIKLGLNIICIYSTKMLRLNSAHNLLTKATLKLHATLPHELLLFVLI